MQNSRTSAPCRTVGVLLFDRFSNHCLANAIEPLRAANTFAGRTLYRWSFLSLDGAQVTSSSGLPVQPETTLARHPGGDYLFLMPSYGFRDQAGPATARALRSAGPALRRARRHGHGRLASRRRRASHGAAGHDPLGRAHGDGRAVPGGRGDGRAGRAWTATVSPAAA
jgi:hypothetical protein